MIWRLPISRPIVWRALLFITALLLVFLVMGTFWPLGPDYWFTFRPVTEAFFRGETRLFDTDKWGYFNAPWGIFLIAPTLLFSPSYGQAIVTLSSMLGLLLSIWAVNTLEGQDRSPVLATVLAMANLHTFDLLIRGNIDGFLLLGLGLGWIGVERRRPLLLGLGLWLLSIKPLNVILIVIVMLWATKDWSRREKLVLVSPLGLTLLFSFPVFGFNWPVRYVQFTTDHRPLVYLQTSLWRAVIFFGLEKQLAFWIALLFVAAFAITMIFTNIEQKNRPLSLGIATNLTISPYAIGSHYVLLAPVFVLLSAQCKWLLGLWFLTLTPLLRLVGGFEVAWIDMVYPSSMMVGMFLLMWRKAMRVG